MLRTICLVLLICMLAGNTLPQAHGRDRFSAVRLESGLTVVPFAVPVATPVAVVGQSQVFYAFAPPAHAPPTATATDGEIDPQLRAEFEAFRRWRQSKAAADATEEKAASTSAPLLAANCLQCHAGANAKGNTRLDGELTHDLRLAAIRAALSGEMPKGKPLSADVLGPLLYELSQPASPTSSPSSPVSGE